MQENEIRDKAWIGDAILGLFARKWILANTPETIDRNACFQRMTSNQFLAGIGEPTKVEAKIGIIYEEKGEQAAFAHIEESILPLFLKQENKRSAAGRHTRKKG